MAKVSGTTRLHLVVLLHDEQSAIARDVNEVLSNAQMSLKGGRGKIQWRRSIGLSGPCSGEP